MTDTNKAGNNTLLAAQPIYDRDSQVAAFELLYRNDLDQSAMEIGDAQATSELLVNLCTGITDQVEHYRKPAFINVSADFLLSRAFLPIDPSKVVIELVERIAPTREIIDAVAAWHAKGFRFALGDFEFGDDWRPLLEFASVIKVDVMVTPIEQALEYRERLRLEHLQWLAERVEDQATHDAYFDAGFQLYQGYFLARPNKIYGKKLNPAALQLTRVIGELYSAEPDMTKVVEMINSDPGLAMSLLKVVNSPLYRAKEPISSVQGVVTRLGLENLRRWLTLIAAVQASSPEVARLVLVRAQFCMELCQFKQFKEVDKDQAFLAGLLSGSGILLSVEPENFLAEIDIEPAVKSAVLQREGVMGSLLGNVLKIERSVAMKSNMDKIPPILLSLYQGVSQKIQILLSDAG